MNTSEFVSPGHPDKIADQISDSILDKALDIDKNSKVAIETMITGTEFGGLVVVGGEMTESTYERMQLDIPKIIVDIVKKNIKTSFDDFDLSKYKIQDVITPQSTEIQLAVENKADQGAGDQGIMIGYATNKTDSLLPETFHRARNIQKDLWVLQNIDERLGLDSKVQFTTNGDSKIVVSCQTNGLETPYQDIKKIVAQHVPAIEHMWTLDINPSGSFQKGGPAADTGVTGRKIVVDAYGPTVAVGGGAYSGKDPSKVDRSGAYACRHLAVNLIEHGFYNEVTVRVAYAIGKADPYEFEIIGDLTHRSSTALESFLEYFDMRPQAIIERLDLLNVNYLNSSQFSHYGDEDRSWEQVVDL